MTTGPSSRAMSQPRCRQRVGLELRNALQRHHLGRLHPDRQSGRCRLPQRSRFPAPRLRHSCAGARSGSLSGWRLSCAPTASPSAGFSGSRKSSRPGGCRGPARRSPPPSCCPGPSSASCISEPAALDDCGQGRTGADRVRRFLLLGGLAQRNPPVVRRLGGGHPSCAPGGAPGACRCGDPAGSAPGAQCRRSPSTGRLLRRESPSYRWYYVPLLMLIAVLCAHGGPGSGRVGAAPPGESRSHCGRSGEPARLGLQAGAHPPGSPRAESRRDSGPAGPPTRELGRLQRIGILGADLPLSTRVVDISGLVTAPVLSAAANRQLFWDHPSQYFVFRWFSGRDQNSPATPIVRRLAPELGPGAPFGSETPFIADARFTRHYRLVTIVQHKPYAALLVVRWVPGS